MATEREKRIKNEFRKKAQEKPEKYYPVRVLMEHGFKRYRCKNCGNYFWSLVERERCGDPNCTGEYEFIGKRIIKPLKFTEVWKKFARFFETLGYTPIQRYPVVARWREDLFFVEASIDDFIPYVLEGVCEPVANPLTVPQFCLRFNDVDNVGVTGRHYTGFVMIGQHAFEKPPNYKPEEYLEHVYLWLTKELKIPAEQIQFHEDTWAGSGKMGPSLEYFSRGLELGNQVYMQFDISTERIRELPLKVLDMGTGQERYVWLSHGTSTSYECVMPTVVEYLMRETGIRKTELFEKFLPYSGMLNLDEVADIDKAWEGVANLLNVELRTLREEVYPLTAIFAIAEHTRSLLFALSDGALPSNVGGGYNLRVILRRSLNFARKFNWQVDFGKIFEEHARFLHEQYPELKEHVDEVLEIFEVERRKFEESRRKAGKIMERLKRNELTPEKIIELYDSHGIHPEELKEKFGIEIPGDFYKRVTERHGEKGKEEKTLPEFEYQTEILFYAHPDLYEFEARVVKIIDNWVVLDRTAFYPRGGGQEPDRGRIASSNVTDVEKKGNTVFHRVDKVSFKEGALVKCVVDKERRERIRAHHTAVHVLNGACRKILGEHVWQAGAYKDEKKARLDITHYENLSEETVERIEELCNEIVSSSLPVEKFVLPRSEAERRYGFRIYQGGAVPGREIRIVRINDFDVEACAGLHVDNTREIGPVILLSSSKIQDGVVRIEICAGRAAEEEMERVGKMIEEIKAMLNCEESEIVNRVKEMVKQKEELERETRRKIKERVGKLVENITFEKIGEGEFAVIEHGFDREVSKEISRKLSAKQRILVIFGKKDKSLFVSCGENAKIGASEIVEGLCRMFSGSGGGSKLLAQGRLEKFEREGARKWLTKGLGNSGRE